MPRILQSFLFVLVTNALWASGPVTWRFGTKEAADGAIQVTLRAICEEGWHLYALKLPRDDGPFPTVIHVTPSALYSVGEPIEPAPTEVEDPNFQMLVRYHGHEAEFIVPVKRISKEAFQVDGEVEFMCCNDKMCLPPVTVKFSVPVAAVK